MTKTPGTMAGQGIFALVGELVDDRVNEWK